jgi:hypothetical protein
MVVAKYWMRWVDPTIFTRYLWDLTVGGVGLEVGEPPHVASNLPTAVTGVGDPPLGFPLLVCCLVLLPAH